MKVVKVQDIKPKLEEGTHIDQHIFEQQDGSSTKQLPNQSIIPKRYPLQTLPKTEKKLPQLDPCLKGRKRIITKGQTPSTYLPVQSGGNETVRNNKKTQLSRLQTPKRVIKEGYLSKKKDGLFSRWSEQYVVLTPQKITWFEDVKRSKAVGCLNLKLIRTELKSKKGEALVLDCGEECQKIIFRTENNEELEEWRQVLSSVLDFQGGNEKLLLKTMSRFTYCHKDILTENEFLNTAQTGDILLFYTQHLGAKMQRMLTNSDFDHVAMVVRMQNRQPMVFQSNQMHGVAIYDWQQYITYFDLYGKVALRRLHYPHKTQIQPKIIQFVRHSLGKKYQLTASKLLTFQSDFNWESVKQERGYFCSELIGKALKSVGLLDEKKASGRYWPVDFAEVGGLELREGGFLGPEETVLLNKHTKNKLK